MNWLNRLAKKVLVLSTSNMCARLHFDKMVFRWHKFCGISLWNFSKNSTRFFVDIPQNEFDKMILWNFWMSHWIYFRKFKQTYFCPKSCFTNLGEIRPRFWLDGGPSRTFFESCPGQSDRSTFEASEQKKWIWSKYFLLPTLLEPKHWILELKHNFPVVLFCIFNELSSCAHQTLLCSPFSFGVFKLWSRLISGPFKMI